MKKVLSVLLSIIMVAVMAVPAFAAEQSINVDTAFRFNSDGKFKIMMLNDCQDTIFKDKMQYEYVSKAIENQQPDLIVFAGDQVTSFLPFAKGEQIEQCIRQFFDAVIGPSGVPFIVTFGNHDHDWEDEISLEEQMAIYKSYDNCAIPDNVFDLGTYNVPVYRSNGLGMALNIYMFDTHNKLSDGSVSGYEGVRPEQLDWYRSTRDSLCAYNMGRYVPSMVFQHIPVKEIYQFVEQVPVTSDLTDAVFNLDDAKWYTLNDKVLEGKMGEVPCSESVDGHTGEYQAWLEKSEIIGAFFGHDHVNNFVGVTDEGIKMGYSAGTGFSTYGEGGYRSVRIFEFDENDVENYTTYEYSYNDVMGSDMDFFVMDLASVTLFTKIFKALVGILPDALLNLFA